MTHTSIPYDTNKSHDFPPLERNLWPVMDLSKSTVPNAFLTREEEVVQEELKAWKARMREERVRRMKCLNARALQSASPRNAVAFDSQSTVLMRPSPATRSEYSRFEDYRKDLAKVGSQARSTTNRLKHNDVPTYHSKHLDPRDVRFFSARSVVKDYIEQSTPLPITKGRHTTNGDSLQGYRDDLNRLISPTSRATGGRAVVRNEKRSHLESQSHSVGKPKVPLGKFGRPGMKRSHLLIGKQEQPREPLHHSQKRTTTFATNGTSSSPAESRATQTSPPTSARTRPSTLHNESRIMETQAVSSPSFLNRQNTSNVSASLTHTPGHRPYVDGVSGLNASMRTPSSRFRPVILYDNSRSYSLSPARNLREVLRGSTWNESTFNDWKLDSRRKTVIDTYAHHQLERDSATPWREATLKPSEDVEVSPPSPSGTRMAGENGPASSPQIDGQISMPTGMASLLSHMAIPETAVNRSDLFQGCEKAERNHVPRGVQQLPGE